MKRLFTIWLLLASFFQVACGQIVTSPGVSTPKVETLGILFERGMPQSKNGVFTSLADFIEPVGAGTSGATFVTVDNGKGAIRFTGGAADYRKVLAWNRYTCLPKYKMTLVLQANTIGNGVGIGTFCMNGINNGTSTLVTAASYNGQTTVGTSTNNLNRAIYAYGTTAPVSIWPADFAGPLAAGDVIKITYEVTNNVATITGRKESKGGDTKITSINFEFPWGVAGAAATRPPTGYFGLFNYGGDYTMTYVKFESNTILGADVYFLGNSITSGYSPRSAESHWPNLVSSTYPNRTFEILAGGGDRTSDILNRMPEILSLIKSGKQSVFVVEAGVNDKNAGVADATINANLTSIYNQITAAGGRVYFLIGETNYATTNMANRDSYLQATYPGRVINAALVAADMASDNQHPNDSGAGKIAAAVISFFNSNNLISFNRYQHAGDNNYALAA